MAETLGYTVTLGEGYRFERGKDVFREYVEHFYEEKRNATDTGSRYAAKLKLNSFYGTFGMTQEQVESKLVSTEEYMKILNSHAITRTLVLDLDT